MGLCVRIAVFVWGRVYPFDMSAGEEIDERLLPHERHLHIMEQARVRSRVEVSTLARELDVTSETIRRDLTVLEQQGRLRRVHGGAVHIERLGYEPSVTARLERQTAEKKRIGRAAVDLLPDGGSILLDSGTTTMEFARRLPSEFKASVVTNSLTIAAMLAERPRVELLVLGGRMRDITEAMVGPWPVSALERIHVDVAFLGTNGVTPESGLTTPDMVEAEVKRAMVAAAGRVVCLADHTKFGLTQLCRFADIADVDVLVTDTGLDEALAEELRTAGPEVIRA